MTDRSALGIANSTFWSKRVFIKEITSLKSTGGTLFGSSLIRASSRNSAEIGLSGAGTIWLYFKVQNFCSNETRHDGWNIDPANPQFDYVMCQWTRPSCCSQINRATLAKPISQHWHVLTFPEVIHVQSSLLVDSWCNSAKRSYVSLLDVLANLFADFHPHLHVCTPEMASCRYLRVSVVITHRWRWDTADECLWQNHRMLSC